VPTQLQSSNVTAASLTISWTASIDNVGVGGYNIARNGTFIASTSQTSYSDTGLSPATAYAYTIAAFDTSGNTSAPSSALSVTTLAASNGLVAAYAFAEGSGTVVNDTSGSSNNGTAAGTTWTAQGKYGSALSFDGTSSTVTIPDSPTLNLTGSFTVSAWVNATALNGYQTIIIKEVTGGCGPWIQTAGDQISSGFNTGSGCSEHTTSTANLQPNTWYFITATFDTAAQVYSIYANGTLLLSESQTGAPATTTQAFVLGRSSAGEGWTGIIDEVRIYSRALTLAEIQADMNTPISGP
jgi:chitodextrinase